MLSVDTIAAQLPRTSQPLVSEVTAAITNQHISIHMCFSSCSNKAGREEDSL
jgi:hypothetical protein